MLAVDTLAQSPRIVGLIPSFAMLAVAALVGAVVAVWATSRGVPASLFLLPLISSLAWITAVTWPTIVSWAGPSIIFPFTLVAVGTLISALSTRRNEDWPRLLTQHVDGRWSAGIAALATAFWLIVLLTSATSLPVTGDEPRYLMVTQSLLEDGDVDLTNNYDAHTYRSFYSGPLERIVTLGYLAQQYSFHGPALSVLLIPGFVLGGVLGSRLLIVLVTAAGAGCFWSAARRATDSAPAAWAGWLAMVSAAPFALHGILMYPDGVAAAVTSFVMLVLVGVTFGGAPRTLAVVAAGLALATLPWLHIRLSISAGVFGLAMVWALAHRRRDLLLPFLAAPLISFVLWIASTWVMFHRLDPTVTFREKAAGSFAQVPVGTLGLLFDAEYGLLTYAPVLTLAVLGLARLCRRSRLLLVVCTTIIVSTLELAAAWIWWGGDSAPARFLVPVVPLIAMCLAAWWADASSRARHFAAVTIVVGACITACLAAAGGGTYIPNAPDGLMTIWEWLSPNVDVSLALPSLFRPGARPGAEAIVAASWLVIGAIAFALTIYWRRHSALDVGASWMLASTAAILWLTAGTAVAWRQRDSPPWTPDRGQLRMLYAATSPALSGGVQGAGWRDDSTTARAQFTTRASAVSSLAISTPFATDTTTRLHVPFVPAGRYTVEVERPAATRGQPAPRLSLSLGRNAIPTRRWFVTPSDEAPTFWLALPVWSVHVEADSASDPPTIVRLRPLQVFAPSPFRDGYALHATIGGPIVVYGMDAYSSGGYGDYEVAANRQASFIVTDPKGHPLPFVVQIETPQPNITATVTHGTFERRALVQPMQPERFNVPAQAESLLPVRVTVSGQPWRKDGRLIGAVVRISQ